MTTSEIYAFNIVLEAKIRTMIQLFRKYRPAESKEEFLEIIGSVWDKMRKKP